MSSLVTSESIDPRYRLTESSRAEEFASDVDYCWEKDGATEAENSHKRNTIRLYEMPEEIIYLIFSFLSVEDLILSVSVVCKTFNDLLTECYFKRRMRTFLGVKDIPRNLKALGVDYGDRPLTWKYSCFKYEHEFHKWSHGKFQNIFKRDFSNHTSSVDVTRILSKGKLLISGSRDRVLSLWDIENCPRLLSFNQKEHSGWIWDVVAYGVDYAFSCDWDGKIFQWSLTNELNEPVNKIQTGRPILCLGTKDNLFVAGSQTGELCLMDPRINNNPEIHSERVQRSAVMAVEIIDDYIVSISEDRTLSVFDIKNYKQIKKSRISSSAIPVSMSKIGSALYVAQTNGSVTLINTSSFKIWDVFSSVNSRLTSIHASNLGCLITASRDAHVTIYSPGKSLTTIKNIEIGAEVARVDYCNGILSIARSDNKITIFNTNLTEK